MAGHGNGVAHDLELGRDDILTSFERNRRLEVEVLTEVERSWLISPRQCDLIRIRLNSEVEVNTNEACSEL